MPRGFGLLLTAIFVAVAILVTSQADDHVGYAVLGGVAISNVAWLTTLVFVGPRLDVSAAISIVEDAGPERSGSRYRVKVLNRSRLFDVGDVEIQAQLVVRGLNPTKPGNSTTFNIPVSSMALFPVLHRRSRTWRKKKAGWQRRRAARAYTLRHRELHGGGLDRLTTPLLQKHEQGKLKLTDLLAIGDDSFVRVVVAASHPLSGYRRSVVVIYDADDLVAGEFEGHDSVKVVAGGGAEGRG